MRLALAAAFALLLTPAAALAQPASAQAMYAERRGMLELDRRCQLFSADIHAALEAGAGQARGALLRGGWTLSRVGELERAAIGAARARACNDPRTVASAAQARSAFTSWTRMSAMSFPGAHRVWEARRVAYADGWRLRQDIDAPRRASFGVRDSGEGQALTLILPLAGDERGPGAAQLLLRDPSRASPAVFDLRGRLASGLAAGAPAPANARSFFANDRRVERAQNGQALLFTFPDAAFQAMLALDPREAAEIRLSNGEQTQRLLIEIGDLSAARAFLVIGAGA
ncbi:MAG: hypothetical protein AB7P07_09575 [Hyphomonadaceae bacterium]